MENLIIQFTDSRKTINIFKGTNALDCQFVIDYRFESSEMASEFAQTLSSKNNVKFV